MTLESFADRTTEFLCKLWLQVHATQKVGEARVRAQRIIATSRIRPWLFKWQIRPDQERISFTPVYLREYKRNEA